MIHLFLLPVMLYVFFLAYVTLIHSKKNGKLAAAPVVVQIVAYAILLTAGVLDFLFNVLIGSFLFLELPRNLMFTTRCESHMKEMNWRGRLARWFCEGWLNPFDENHCH